MSSLENKKIKDSYKDLLQISNTNTGIDNTLRSISDGGGTISALKISSSEVSIDGNLEANSITINNKSVATQDWVTSNTSTGALINWTETNGNIIPNSNASFDLGNAEYKVRHLFLSDNSMWLGDEIKLESYAKKKRNRSKLPKWFEVNTPGVTTEEIFNWHNTEFDLENKISSFEEISLFALTEFAKIKIGNSELTSSDIYPSQYNEDGSINDIYDPLDYEYIIDDDQSFKVNSFLSNLNSSNTEERKQKILQIDETGDGIQFVDQELLQGERGMQGIAGPQGDSGPQGIPGLQGDIGLKGEQGDAFVFSDFTTEQLESLVGEKGNKGETAPRGIDGSDGEKGEKGIQGNPGSQGITGPQGDIGLKGEQGDGFVYSDFTTSQLESLVGEKGDKGDQGIPGLQGDIGLKGDQGIQGDKGDAGDKGDQGIPGLQGDIGLKGDQGIQGEIGPQGLKGDKGDTGDTGDIGLQGDAGQGYTNAQILNGELILTPTLGENVNLGNVIGPQGIQGEQGSRGFTGATGATGPGYVNSSISESGDLILTTTSGENLNLGNVIGPQGIQGIQGEAGNNGQDGVGFSNGESTGQIYYSGGNVGIGTDNPSSVLTINHVYPQIRFEDADGDPAHVTQVGSYNGTMYFDCDMANPVNTEGRTSGKGFVFRTDANTTETPNGNELVVINQTGNVGIGTNSPAEKLTVIGDILIDNNMNSTLYLGKGAEGVDGVTKIKCTQTGTDTDELGLSFFVHGSSSGTTVPYEAMSITHTGNVGIGTTSPNAKLEISGGGTGVWLKTNNITNRSSNTMAGQNYINLTNQLPTDENSFEIGPGYINLNRDDNVPINQLSFGMNGMLSAAFEVGGTTNSDHSLRFKVGQNDSNKAGIERMRISSDGSIGINTTSPSSTFHVVGSATIESSSPLLVLKDTDGGDDVKQTGFISYRDNDNVERGWVGFGSSSNKHFGIRNNIGNMQISASNNVEIYGSCMGLNTSVPSGGGIGGNHFEVKSSSASGIHLNRVNGQGEAVVDFTIYSGSTNFVMYDNKNSADRLIITDAGDTHFAGHVGSKDIGLSYGENTASSLSCMQWKNNYGSGNTSGGALILAHNANASWANAYINSFNYSSGKETRLIQWLINGEGKGSIRHNGSSISYETTSDYRTKKNIVNLNDGLQRVNLLNPIKHEWVDEITDGVFDGFLAHEVQQIVPEAVSGVKDQVTQDNKIVPQSMDACKLIPILTSAIQELSKKVDDLQDQINTLKQN